MKWTLTLFTIFGFLSVFFLLPPLTNAFTDGFYQQTNLVSDVPGKAMVTDPNLVNPWGLSHSETSPWWISDNGTGNASVYNGEGVSVTPAVTIPLPQGATGSATPTGNVFNKVNALDPDDFTVKEGTLSGPSIFMFATEDGTISGWNPQVDKTKAILAVDRSTTTDGKGDIGAVYKGLAFGRNSNDEYIYATNFRFGTVEMFNENFTLVKSFTDSQLTSNCPMLNQCFAPFGIQNIDGKLYVTFALQNEAKHDDQKGAGNGFVDIFTTDGRLVGRFVSNGKLNSPWGIALSPYNFGKFKNDILVGNFGDGMINAYDKNGNFDGQLQDKSNMPIVIDGLWSIAFGNNNHAGKKNELFFSAGINDESHGLFGKISPQNQ